MKKNRLLSLLLCAAMCFSLFPAAAFAEEPEDVLPEQGAPAEEAMAAEEMTDPAEPEGEVPELPGESTGELAMEAPAEEAPAEADAEEPPEEVPEGETEEPSEGPAEEAPTEEPAEEPEEEPAGEPEEPDPGAEEPSEEGKTEKTEESADTGAAEDSEEEEASEQPVTEYGFDVVLNPDFPWLEESDLWIPSEEEIQAASAQTPSVVSVSKAISTIRTAMENRKQTVTVTLSRNPDPNHKELLMKAMEHTGVPTQGDYIRGHYWGYVLSYTYTNSIITFTYAITYSSDASQEASVNKRVNSLKSSLSLNQGTDYERVRRIYRYLTANVSYDHKRLEAGDPPIIHTAYAALIENKCVCQGFAVAFYRLSLEAGVDARYIVSTGMGHAWNIARIGGRYYYLDSTWDEQEENYRYFLLGRDDLLRNHDLGDDFNNSSFASRYQVPAGSFNPTGISLVPINQSYFPDANFCKYVPRFDRNGDGLLSGSEFLGVNTISVNSCNLTSLQGIEYFTELTKLECREQSLTSLDLRKLTKLEYLNCGRNRIHTLLVFGHPGWKYMCCASNDLREINARGLTALGCLDASYNPLESLDVSNCTSLERVYCRQCKLTKLNVTGCPNLLTILARDNRLQTLDLTSCEKLRYLECQDNLFSSLDVSWCPDLLRAMQRGTRTTEGAAVIWKEAGASSEYDNYYLSVDSRTNLITHHHTPGTPIKKNVVAPTCTEKGTYEEVVKCTECGEVLSREKKTINASGHKPDTPVRENEIPPTCTEKGTYDEVVKCTECGEVLSREKKTINASGHKPDTPIRENEIPATCTTEESYDEVVYCSVCMAEISREKKKNEKLPHTPELVGVKEPTIAEEGYSGDLVCSVCGALIEKGDVIPILVPDWTKMPAELQLDREYVLLGEDVKTVRLNTSLTDKAFIYLTEWTTESGTSDVVSVHGGEVTARGAGTDYVVATLSNGEESISARCRVDVLDEGKQRGIQITASLPVTKLTTELLKTDYTRIPIVLNLIQNVTVASVTLADGTELEDTGVMIEKAIFVGGGKADIRKAFGLRVADDRTLELIPIINVKDTEAVKAVAGSYKSAIHLVLSDGTETDTAEVTVTVRKSQPKLTVKPVTVNSFITGQTVPLEITGGTVRSIPVQNLGYATLNSDLTVTVNNSVAKSGSQTVTLYNVELEDWAVPAKLTITVKNQYKTPKVTLKPATVTVNKANGDIAVASVSVTPLEGMNHVISTLEVPGLNVSYDQDTENVTVSAGSAGVGSYKVPIQADTTTVAYLNVKVIDGTPSITAKVSGTINPNVKNSPAIITVTGRNYNAVSGTYKVTIQQNGADVDPNLFQTTQKGNMIYVTAGTETPADGKYTAIVSCPEAGEAKPVNLTVKTVKAPAMTVTLKAAGSIDILRGTGQVTVTPTIKNEYDFKDADLTLKLPKGLQSSEYRNGRFIVTAVQGAEIDPNDKTVTLELKGAEIPKAKTTLQLNQGKATVNQSTKTVTLSKNDRFDRQSVILSLSDSTLYGIRDVVPFDSKGAVTVTPLGNGEYAVGYIGNRIPADVRGGRLKTTTLKLNVFLQGNGGNKANATLSVKVNFG